MWTFPIYQKRVAGEGLDGQLAEHTYQFRSDLSTILS